VKTVRFVLASSIGALIALRAGSGCNDTGPTLECYELLDGGTGPICSFGSGDEPVDGSCATGFRAGTCPASVSKSDLAGCCVETETQSENQEPTVTITKATCYYSAALAKGPKSKCTGVTAEGYPQSWSTTPP
jgi:hypothetical protein